MFFKLTLPEEAKEALTEAGRFQFAVLEWAASVEDDGSDEAKLLDSFVLALQSNGCVAGKETEACRWLRNSQDRLNTVLLFARAADSLEKTRWCRDLAEQHLSYLSSAVSRVEPLIAKENQKPWHKFGSDMLIMFYEQFRGKSGLPGFIFSSGRKYSSQEFLRSLIKEESNTSLALCSFCLESTAASITNDHIYTDIDHFLPKADYPHLSIHPFNLIPTCHLCNSGFKGEHDPLSSKGGRRSVDRIWMPYQSPGLVDKVLLVVENPTSGTSSGALARGGGVRFARLKAKSPLDQLDEIIEVLEEIYGPVRRWQGRVDVIGEKLFRRMKDFLRFFVLNPGGFDPSYLEVCLDELLYYFETEELYREPYALPMLWWLAQMISQELKVPDSVLREEIQRWSDSATSEAEKRRKHGEGLRLLLLS